MKRYFINRKQGHYPDIDSKKGWFMISSFFESRCDTGKEKSPAFLLWQKLATLRCRVRQSSGAGLR